MPFKQKRPGLIALGALAVLCALALVLSQVLAPKPTDGDKTITVNVDHLSGGDRAFTLRTDADYLRGALEAQGLIAGEESQYGLWVQTVDGETADETLQQWWSYDCNGVLAENGVDTQPVADGDVYDFVLHVGY